MVNSAFEMGGKNKEKGGRSAREPPEQLYRFFSKADMPQLSNVQNSFKHARDFPTLCSSHLQLRNPNGNCLHAVCGKNCVFILCMVYHLPQQQHSRFQFSN